VNLWGVIHGVRTFVPILLRQADEGHVVNTAAMAGLLPMPFLAAYHASKFAVVSLSETLHHELALTGARVKVSLLCPGFVRPAILESGRNRPAALRAAGRPVSAAGQAFRAALEEGIAGGLSPEEVAGRVFEAVRDERFYVFPHPELLEHVRQRAETIAA